MLPWTFISMQMILPLLYKPFFLSFTLLFSATISLALKVDEISSVLPWLSGRKQFFSFPASPSNFGTRCPMKAFSHTHLDHLSLNNKINFTLALALNSIFDQPFSLHLQRRGPLYSPTSGSPFGDLEGVQISFLTRVNIVTHP